MKTMGKVYGYNIIAPEFMATVDGLWDSVMDHVDRLGKGFPPFLRAFGDEHEYNGVHFWYDSFGTLI